MELFFHSSWYVNFNLLEGVLWWVVAVIVAIRCPASSPQQRWAATGGSMAFVIFGITDWFECRYEGQIPLWLWGMKIACGAAFLTARYTWLGWGNVRFPNREFWFALFCLVCVIGLIWFQSEVNSSG